MFFKVDACQHIAGEETNYQDRAKYLYTIPIHAVSACQTVPIITRNGPFRKFKRSVWERKIAQNIIH